MIRCARKNPCDNAGRDGSCNSTNPAVCEHSVMTIQNPCTEVMSPGALKLARDPRQCMQCRNTVSHEGWRMHQSGDCVKLSQTLDSLDIKGADRKLAWKATLYGIALKDETFGFGTGFSSGLSKAGENLAGAAFEFAAKNRWKSPDQARLDEDKVRTETAKRCKVDFDAAIEQRDEAIKALERLTAQLVDIEKFPEFAKKAQEYAQRNGYVPLDAFNGAFESGWAHGRKEAQTDAQKLLEEVERMRAIDVKQAELALAQRDEVQKRLDNVNQERGTLQQENDVLRAKLKDVWNSPEFDLLAINHAINQRFVSHSVREAAEKKAFECGYLEAKTEVQHMLLEEDLVDAKNVPNVPAPRWSDFYSKRIVGPWEDRSPFSPFQMVLGEAWRLTKALKNIIAWAWRRP